MTRIESAIVAAFAAALVVAAAATARAQGKEMKVENWNCWGGTAILIAPVKDTVLATYQLTGTTRSVTPGGFLDGSSFECIGSSEVIAGAVNMAGHCLVVDKTGDKVWGRTTRNKDEDSFVYLGGTGKYQGITGKIGYARPVNYPSPRAGTFTGCALSSGTARLP